MKPLRDQKIENTVAALKQKFLNCTTCKWNFVIFQVYVKDKR